MDTTNRGADPDELAIQRYRYLLRTAPPEALEAAHREAFEQLTPEQRRRVLEGLAAQVDPDEIRNADASPGGLARLATRAELRQPGTMERAFAGDRGGGGFGGSFLGMLAGAFIGTSIANAMFADDVSGADAGSGDPGSMDEGSPDDPGSDGGELGGFGDDGGFDGGGFDGGGFDIGF